MYLKKLDGVLFSGVILNLLCSTNPFLYTLQISYTIFGMNDLFLTTRLLLAHSCVHAPLPLPRVGKHWFSAYINMHVFNVEICVDITIKYF